MSSSREGESRERHGDAAAAAQQEAFDAEELGSHRERRSTAVAETTPSDVVGFLRAHPPFDALEPEEVQRVARSAEVEFFLAGSLIFAQGAAPVEHLRVVRTGAVEIVLGASVLDLLGPGELFGQASMLSGLPTGFAARAREDTLCYRIPEEVAREALTRPASVGFLARSLLEMRSRTPAQAARGPAADPANAPVSALLHAPALLCSPAATIREAAARMSAAPANAIVVELGETLGIITDRDLRSRVVAQGTSYDAPVTSVMSAPAYTVGPDALGGDVLLEMLDRGVRHFPVVGARGEVLGVVEAVDLLAVEELSSFRLHRAIGRAGSVGELARAATGLAPTVIALHEARLAAASITAIHSVMRDALVRRLIELELEAAGPSPAEFSWLVLGSQARREASPASDAESAIVWYGGVDERVARPYLHTLAGRVLAGLEECGVHVDSHGASASELPFVRSLESWREVAQHWLEHPNEDQVLMLSSVLVDSRPAWGVHLGNLVSEAFRAARRHPQMLRLLARSALAHRPPTGFLRGLVVEHDGEHRGHLDLKNGGLLPIVDLARWAGMAAGVAGASTRERLRAASAAGTLPAADARTLEDAFELLSELRIAHHVERLRAGLAPEDFLDPNGLSSLTRSYLKEAFRAVASVQRRVASTHGLVGA